jgi:hypothetical protein
MRSKWWKTAALIVAVGVYGSGCIVNVGPSRTRYASCAPTDNCAGISTCQASPISLAGMGNGNLCTQSCSNDSSCPSASNGNPAVCLAVAGTSGQCFSTCATGTDCPAGTACGEVNRGGLNVRVCVPGTSSGACGGIGQPCCAGSTCTEANAACASDNLCKPAAYVGCTAASVEARAQCADAVTNGGAVRVQTTCQRPPFTNAGPAGFCTAVCDGTNTGCPSFPGATSGCYRFEGMTSPMCFVDCAANPTVCPTGTACVELTGNTGARVRVCAPPVR